MRVAALQPTQMKCCPRRPRSLCVSCSRGEAGEACKEKGEAGGREWEGAGNGGRSVLAWGRRGGAAAHQEEIVLLASPRAMGH